MISVLLLLLPLPDASQEVAKPITVNGEELGAVEAFRNQGPGRVCLENAAFDMVKGEAAALQYAGIHSASIIVTGPEGNLLVRHGDSWAKPGKLTTVWQDGAQSIRRGGRGSRTEYLYFAPTEYSDGEAQLVLRVSGKVLKGNNSDLPRLHRLTLHSNAPDGCLRRYTYGWDMLMGDEPLSTGDKE